MINKSARKNTNPKMLIDLITTLETLCYDGSPLNQKAIEYVKKYYIEDMKKLIEYNKIIMRGGLMTEYNKMQIDTMLDAIEMIETAPYGTVPIIRNIKEIN